MWWQLRQLRQRRSLVMRGAVLGTRGLMGAEGAAVPVRMMLQCFLLGPIRASAAQQAITGASLCVVRYLQ